MGQRNGKLPVGIAAELLQHMSKVGRFDQTLSEFPDLDLHEVRSTFAWLADTIRSQDPEQTEKEQAAESRMLRQARYQQMRDWFENDESISDQTKMVLRDLSPEDQFRLLKNFGAID